MLGHTSGPKELGAGLLLLPSHGAHAQIYYGAPPIPLDSAGPSAFTQQPRELINLRGADPRSCETVTVTLGAPTLPNGPALEALPDGARANIVAIVEWGQGSTTFKAYLDWRSGQVLNRSASSLVVSAGYDERPEAEGTLYTFPLTVAAAVGNMPRGGCARPTRTYPQVSIPAEGEIVYYVPPFAARLGLMSPELPATLEDLDFQLLGAPKDGQEIFAGDAAELRAAALGGLGVVITEAARFVRFQNTGETACLIAPFFELSL